MSPTEVAVVVERPAVPMMFRRTADEQESITRAWAEVEAKFASVRGRRFYGTFDPASREYRVCVEALPGDEAAALGLESGSLPGGRYARVRLRGEPPELYARIAPAFQSLSRRPDADPSRPMIEFYRSRDQVDLLLPVV